MDFLGEIVGLIVILVQWWMNHEKKTKIEKAREIILKNRAKLAREKHNQQVRDTDAMEKDHDDLMVELATVLSVRGKDTSKAK